MRAVDQVLGSLDLRGRRQERAVIVFTEGDARAVEHASVLATVPLEEAAAAAVEALAEPPVGSLDRR